MAEFLKEELILPATDDRIFKTLLTHSNAELVLIDILFIMIRGRIRSTDSHRLSRREYEFIV